MQEYLKIDENGYALKEQNVPLNKSYFVNPLYLNEDEEIPEGYILAPNTTTKGYYKPRWNGIEWIEGATEQEITGWKGTPQPSTETVLLEYVADLDYRLSLKEMGL